MRSMRAALIAGPQRARVIDAARPEPTGGEVRVRLEGCGVCGSNGPVWQGRPWFEYPLTPGAPGHEGWGWIDTIGDGVTQLRVGQRVAFLSDRAFAEYDTCAAAAVVPLPAAVHDLPFPGEALGCAMNVFARSGIQRGDDVAIVGVGFLGVLLVALAADAGARVIAISRRAFPLELADSYGAETITWHDAEDVVRRVADLTDGQGCRVVVEAAGVQPALDLATRLTREHGRLVIAGYHQDGSRTVDMQLWNWRALDVINAHERDPLTYVRGMHAAVTAVVAGALDLRPLLTHTYALEELGAAMRALHERPAGFLKALVVP
jgi:threonine dehydrogenase-like Zn-dependent dehydrogenase